MTSRIDLKRAFLAALTAGAVAFALVLVAGGSPASANHVNPVFHEGNVNCGAASGTTEILKLEGGNLANGTYPAGSGSITVSNLTPNTFDWSSTGVVISAVFVKAGNGGNLYNYLPAGEIADTGLETPGKNAISHITFCSGGTTPTTEPPTTEPPTTVPEVTTTVPETTTTIPDEVSPTSIVSTTTTIVSTTDTGVSPETLPFTGFENGATGLLALVLVASGALALVGTRVFRGETDE